jgi:hypothetical protein
MPMLKADSNNHLLLKLIIFSFLSFLLYSIYNSKRYGESRLRLLSVKIESPAGVAPVAVGKPQRQRYVFPGGRFMNGSEAEPKPWW